MFSQIIYFRFLSSNWFPSTFSTFRKWWTLIFSCFKTICQEKNPEIPPPPLWLMANPFVTFHKRSCPWALSSLLCQMTNPLLFLEQKMFYWILFLKLSYQVTCSAIWRTSVLFWSLKVCGGQGFRVFLALRAPISLCDELDNKKGANISQSRLYSFWDMSTFV